MHMADALISPAVGITMIAASSAVAVYSIKKLKMTQDEKIIPVMGVMGAFIFAAQMVNFTIPFTGSSGHIGGGLMLSVLLGPYAGFLVLTTVLLIQAFFFADGGILALGCNVFNLGIFTCFVAYPLVYKKIARNRSIKSFNVGIILAAIVGLQLGSLGVVAQTVLSAKTEIPFLPFLALMQPVHLVIGIAEGLITASVLSFIYKFSPELMAYNNTLLPDASKNKETKFFTSKKFALIILLTAMALSLAIFGFISTNPDGLEWSIEKVLMKD